jgi:DNA polymerase-3 subunit alpha
MVKSLERKRVQLYANALNLARDGSDAMKMAGVVRRKQERAGRSGDKFAFVTLSDPTGEYEVLFPPEVLRRCRELLEPGKSIVLKVRAKAGDGEVRFFGDDAEPLERAIEGAIAAVRVHVQSRSVEIEALKKKIETSASPKGGEIIMVAGLPLGREIEMRLPGRYALDASLRSALKTAPGVAYLEDV